MDTDLSNGKSSIYLYLIKYIFYINNNVTCNNTCLTIFDLYFRMYMVGNVKIKVPFYNIIVEALNVGYFQLK